MKNKVTVHDANGKPVGWLDYVRFVVESEDFPIYGSIVKIVGDTVTVAHTKGGVDMQTDKKASQVTKIGNNLKRK